MRIGIVGAGLSGLATAFYIRRAHPGAEVVVFEAAERGGGALRTVDVQGFLFEWGGNGFLTNKPDCLGLLQDSGGQHLLLPSSDLARKRYLYTDALHRMPDSPGLFARSPVMTAGQKLRMLGELFVPARRDGVDESLREFGNRRLGAGFTNVFLDAMSAGIYGSTPDRISVKAAFPLIVSLEQEYGGLFRGMLAKRKKEAGPGGVLTSTVRGVSTMIDHVAAQGGATIRYRDPVAAVERVGARYVLHAASGAQEFDQVVVASPSYAAAELLRPLDADIARRLAAIQYSPIAVVGFGYRNLAHPLDGFGLLTTSSAKLPVLGVLWDSSVFPDRAPAGSKILRSMIGGQRSPELVDQDDAGLIATALRGIEMTMGVAQPPDVTFVKRWDRGIPSYAPGHIAAVDELFAQVAKHPGLHLNNNAYRGIAMNDCARNSRELAARL